MDETLDAGGPGRTLELGDELEQQRIYASLHKKMFGRGEELKIGNYRVLRRIGVGGMGEVYLCEDPRLGRRVALKRVIGGGSELEQERLRREARALAALAHDNIVVVHEIGEHEGDLFVAMEYIEGEHLGQWLNEAPAPAQRIEHLLEAGRGLAAAHAAGFVHRDFKPENVLIARDGRVKVADFGLVLAHGEAARVSAGGPESPQLGARLSAGHVLGTLLYMPPEQLRGEEADARSDQFAFCLVAYEAVWGAAPFTLASVESRLVAMEHGQVLEPAGKRALYRVLRRGLAADPAARWPDMDALLVALARASAAPRRRWRAAQMLVVGALLGAGLFMLVTWVLAQRPSSCELASALVWSADVRERLAEKGAELDADERETLLIRVRAGLDNWRSAHLEACALEAARPCLDAQARRVGVVVAQMLAREDSELLVDAAAAMPELPDPRGCALRSDAQPMAAPDLAGLSQRGQLRRELDELHALRVLGAWAAARARRPELEAKARALGDDALLAEVLAEAAKLEDEDGELPRAIATYAAAQTLALRTGNDALAAELGLERAELLLDRDEAVARELFGWVRDLAARAGFDARGEARLHVFEGRLALREGAFDDELHAAMIERLARAARDAGADAPAYLTILAGLSKDRADALALRRQAMEAAALAFGPSHPRTAGYIYDYGAELLAVDEREGQRWLGEAAELWARHPPRSPRRQAQRVLAEAQAALVNAEFEAVELHALHLEQLAAQHLDASDEHQGMPAYMRAKARAVRADLGDPRGEDLRVEALEQSELALLAFERSGSAAQQQDTLLLRVDLLVALRRLDEAQEVALRYASVSEDPFAALRLAEIALLRGQLDEADTQLRSLTTDLSGHPTEAVTFELLRALCDVRRTPAQVRAQLSEVEVPEGHRAWLLGFELDAAERLYFGLEWVPTTK